MYLAEEVEWYWRYQNAGLRDLYHFWQWKAIFGKKIELSSTHSIFIWETLMSYRVKAHPCARLWFKEVEWYWRYQNAGLRDLYQFWQWKTIFGEKIELSSTHSIFIWETLKSYRVKQAKYHGKELNFKKYLLEICRSEEDLSNNIWIWGSTLPAAGPWDVAGHLWVTLVWLTPSDSMLMSQCPTHCLHIPTQKNVTGTLKCCLGIFDLYMNWCFLLWQLWSTCTSNPSERILHDKKFKNGKKKINKQKTRFSKFKTHYRNYKKFSAKPVYVLTLI